MVWANYPDREVLPVTSNGKSSAATTGSTPKPDAQNRHGAESGAAGMNAIASDAEENPGAWGRGVTGFLSSPFFSSAVSKAREVRAM